jgi:hypothetical protein
MDTESVRSKSEDLPSGGFCDIVRDTFRFAYASDEFFDEVGESTKDNFSKLGQGATRQRYVQCRL